MKQSVALNGYCLFWVDIGAGLPRGSIPGPLLFLTCPSDLPKFMTLILLQVISTKRPRVNKEMGFSIENKF